MNSYGRGEDNRKKSAGYFITRETFGMTLLLFSGILFVISCIGPYMLGEIGVAISAFLLGLCGFYIYPLLLFGVYLSIVMISGKRLFSGKWLLRGTLLAVSAFLIAHLATSARFLESGSFGSYMEGCWTAAEVTASRATGGGLLFGLVVYPAQALLSTLGAYILFSALAAISVFLILRATPLLKSGRAPRPAKEKKREGEKTFDELPPRTAEKRAPEPRAADERRASQAAPQTEQDDRPRRPEPPRQTYQQPQSYEPPHQTYQQPQSYEPPRQTYQQPQSYEPPRQTYQQPQSYEPPRTYTGRDILYGNPANDYKRNLIYSNDSYFNSRASRKSSVDRRDIRQGESAYSPRTYQAPSETYQSRYGMQAETPREPAQRRIVEQRPEQRDSGFTYRDVNYPQRPSYKTPEVPPEKDEPLDSYRNDVPYEPEDFSSAPNVREIPDPPAEELEIPAAEPGEEKNKVKRAPRAPISEPVKSEPRAEEPIIEEPMIGDAEASAAPADTREEFRSVFSRPSRRNGTDEDKFSAGSGRDFAAEDLGLGREERFDGRFDEELGESMEEPRFEEPARVEPRIEEPDDRFGEELADERPARSRALGGLRSGDLFDDDEIEEALMRTREEARASLPPAPRPKPHVYKPYRTPSMALFRKYDDRITVPPEEVDRNSSIIVDTLAGFRVDARIVKVTVGPAVTRYDIDIPGNISLGMVTKRSGEIAMRLHARDGVNMYANNEAGTISIEVPNSVRATVGLASVMQAEEYRKDKPGSLMFAIGKDVEGRNVCGDIPKMTHILVAGTTNAGKSVCLNAMLISLVCKYSPEDLRIILVDPKKVEFPVYEGLPHLMINEIIADAQKAITALNWAIKEMERRYDVFEQKTRSGTVVRNIDEYNANRSEDEAKLPRIVIVVDELADLMSVAKKDIEERIQRLTQKARAAGIHLVLATQRPSVDVITGVIKGNLPTRMAVRVIQEVDSRTILDESGAEKLLGMGDMLYKTGGMFNCLRVQGAFISSEEVQAIVEDIKQNNEAYFDPEVSDYINRSESESGGEDSEYGEAGGAVDPVYIQALKVVVKLGSASISLIQRKCSVGYNHAGKIMEWMEVMGYVSPFDGKAKARTVLLTKEEFENTYGSLD